MYQLASIAFVTGAVAVFQYLEIGMSDRIQDGPRRFNIGLTDVEVVHLDAFFPGCFGKRYQLADGRSWHDGAAVTDW